jgi:hypothetical protein
MNALATIPVSAEDAKQAARYNIRFEPLTPRAIRVIGPNGAAEIRRGAGDGNLRLFEGKTCHGVMSVNYIFAEAFDLVSHKFSQDRFHAQMAVAEEGEI